MAATAALELGELVFGAGEADREPSTSPSQPLRSASAIRAGRLSRISASRSRWVGSGQSIGHLTHAGSWMHGVPNAHAQVPMETFRRSKWNGGLGRTAQWPVSGSRRVPNAARTGWGVSAAHSAIAAIDRAPAAAAAPGARPWVRDGGQVGEQVRCFGFLGGIRHCANHTTVAAPPLSVSGRSPGLALKVPSRNPRPVSPT